MAGNVKLLYRSDGTATNAPTTLVFNSTQVSFTVNNNVSVPIAVSGFGFSNTQNLSGHFLVDIKRDDDVDSFREIFDCLVYWDGSDWKLESRSIGDTSGVSLDMSAGGSLTYTSSNMTGGNYSGSGEVANIIKVNV